MKLFAVLFLVTIAFVYATSAATFYVDPQNGDMSNNGSAELPWMTIEKVIKNNLIQTHDKSGKVKNPHAPVKAGDTILLRSGYHGEIYIRNAYNDDFITIAAYPGDSPKLKRVFFAAASKWIIRGLNISPTFAPEYKRDRLIQVVNWGGPVSDFVIENNLLQSVQDASSWSADQWDKLACNGINVIGENITIRNNTLQNISHGIVVTGDKITVQSNNIEHISGDGIVCSADNTSLLYNTMKHFYNVNANHDDGIQFHRGRDKTTPIHNAIVRGNRVIAWDGKVTNPLIHSPQGICNFDIPAIGWRIENNLVLVKHHHGITINGCQNGIIVNNLAYNPYGERFYAGISLGTTHGKTESKNTIVRNNLVDSKIDYPKEVNTVDSNIIVDDPSRYFLDPEVFDMRHKSNSPAIDAGTSEKAPKVDIIETPRPQGKRVDLGPFELRQD